MFKLNIKSGGKKILYKNLSISVKYLIDEKKFEQSFLMLQTVFHTQFSKLQIKNFLSGSLNQIRITKHEGKPDSIILCKVKIDNDFTSDYFRNHLAGLVNDISKEEVEELHIFIPSYRVFKKYFSDEKYYYQSFVEGLHLGNYVFDKYKYTKSKQKKLDVILHAENGKQLNSAISRADFIMKGHNFTRDLQNEPASALRPFELAKKVTKVLTDAGVKVTVFNEKEIVRRKMGGLIAVGQGSANKPRFIVIRYKPKSKGSKKIKKIALVGKGVTFDSGGISIKPATNMGEMKGDMSGAAVVAGTVLAAAEAKLPVEILGVIPSAENMLSGESMRPGDIVTTASGKTIEVDNTDAEGRMILADALDFASKEKPNEIIDFATLTGACVVALGQNCAGLFTNNDKIAKDLIDAGIKSYDRVWRMPMWKDYEKLNDSKVADIKNVGGKWAGAITAAKFLEFFVDKKITWAHLDIAGAAFAHDMTNYTKTFMTGFGVRLMFEYLSKK